VLASDLGFMALGGIVGLLAGAALIAVLRTRPPSPRQIRLTVTPGSVPIRPSRTTLAGDPFTSDPRWVALGGPADPSRVGTDAPYARGIGRRARNGTPVRSAAPHDTSPSPPEAETVTDTRAVQVETESVGLTIDSGTDPVFAAIASARDTALAEVGLGASVLVERPSSPVPLLMTEAGSGVAILEAAIHARRSAAEGSADGSAGDVSGSVMVMTRAEQTGTTDGPGPGARAARGSGGGSGGSGGSGGGSGDGGGSGGGASDDGSPTGAADGATAEADPCADARHTVDERCALAERMRLTAEHAADALREAQRTLDEHAASAAAAEAIAEPRAQRSAKDEAQSTFRSERTQAGSRESVEQAARDWLQEINRINAAAREAAATLAREREAGAAVLAAIERLTIEADAARVQAEGAEESCVLARGSLATCEDDARAAAQGGSASAGGDGGGTPEGGDEPTDDTPVAVPAPARARVSSAASSAPEPAPVEEVGALAAAIQAGAHPAILGLLTGDRAVMQRLVWELAGEDPVNQRRWQVQLADLVDAIVSRAIEACAFVFPDEHLFWSPFTRRQSRDIALALSSLGFRFDGLGGFADDRVPTQRDVSLALGYAGLDPMRVRRWPAEMELAELYAEVTVAADEYILGAAPGLTLGELVGILGRRADALTEVWNAWGQISPILLEDIGAQQA
jgi:hypothetical protein